MTIVRQTTDRSPRRVLLVGWDAADWQIIHPLVEQGLMPTTAALLQRGAWGNLATTRPILSPILWNTIATGKRADKHGVCGFTEPTPDGPGIRPTASTSRKCKALWNILTQCGLRSNVVGWYASHPAEPIAGAMASNQLEHFSVQDGKLTPLPAGCVHPPELAADVAACRVHPSEIDASAILPFVPAAAELADRPGSRLGKLQYMLAQTATVHAATTWLMSRDDWDFTAVYYEGIDRFGHEFMEFHPPKMAEVSEEDFQAYRHCMTGIYRFHDMLLDTLLKLAGDDAAVILMSDHGYYNDHLRPDPREGRAGPTDWHRPFGVLAAAGPGVRAGARLYGASILDVTPTVLGLLGLPAAHDMPGRVLAEAFDGVADVRRIESWEEIDGPCGMHAAELRVDPAESQAMLAQLVALGYVDPPDADDDKTRRETLASNQFQLAQSHVDAGEFAAAVEIVEQLDPIVRESTHAQILLASCLLGTGDRVRAREVLERLEQRADGRQDVPRLHMMLGALEFAEGRVDEALLRLQRVSAAEPRLPGLHARLGETYLAMARYQEAIGAFEKALTLDAESPVALAGLAKARLELGDPQAALDDALVAAGLVHHFPRIHLIIGRALLQLGDDPGAVEALELCVKQAPRWKEAHEVLAQAYRSAGRTADALKSELRARGVMS
jgi:tetratricopeptide (TPR) repeat protein